MSESRKQQAKNARDAATNLALTRYHPTHQSNADEARFRSANYPMSFTKGLDHDKATGLVADASDFESFREAVYKGEVESFTSRVSVPRDKARRQWEAPTAGLVFDLQGPDPESVTMAPAPELCSDELTFEMAEVYELALLRDVPFNRFDDGGGSTKLTQAIARLNNLKYAKNGFQGRPRKTDKDTALSRQTVFRGSSPGVEKGPYLSQFLIVGNEIEAENISPEHGYIKYGAQRIDQRVLETSEGDDYLVKWDDWLHVQKGFRIDGPLQGFTGKRRFIYTPRDLATYVHFDALYQAYLNACLILLGNGTPFDSGFDLLSGKGKDLLINPADGQKVGLNAGGFALWGGPHILSLVTEVATRALKAVRYQKFNVHLRARPEVLAARIEKATEIEHRYPSLCGCFSTMAEDLCELVGKIRQHNKAFCGKSSSTTLLPMAFAEGSPMHPSYGAGHASVAGACITILKAFFDTSASFVKIGGNAGFFSEKQIVAALEDNKPKTVEVGAYQVKASSKKGDDFKLDFDRCGEYKLTKQPKKITFKADDEKAACCPLTLEGELNKLAANISIGRNIAGVHYFSDYYDSLRMGEEIAIGILEEQALCYDIDPFVLSLPTFDGDLRRIGRR